MIYFIQCGTNGPIKIGYTDNDVQARMAQLQTGCPYELKLLWVYTGEDFTEAQVHSELAHERVRGEWFHPSKNLYEFMRDKLPNTHIYNSPNGATVDISEGFLQHLNISIDTNIETGFGFNKSASFYFDQNSGDIDIEPANEKAKIFVYGIEK